MYFLCLLILCYTSILTPGNTYIVLAANLNDFRSLAKEHVQKNIIGQIKAMVLENGHKYYKEPSKDDDRTIEYLDDSQQDDSYEVTKEFKTRQQPVDIYQVKSAPKVTLAEPIAPHPTATVLTIDDIVEKVKQRLFQQILDKSVNARDTNAQAKSQAGSAQTGDSLAYKNFPKKSFKETEAKSLVKNPVYKSVPMKVIKEEVQFEATYEDTLNKDTKPQIQYRAQYLQSKSVTDDSKNRLVNTQYEGGVKKVRFVKQVLVPANSNQRQSTYVPQPSMVQQPMQQPSLGQQPSTVQHSNLEPQLSLMQQPSMVQMPMYLQLYHQANIQQSTIMKQLVIMQQQIEQLARVLNRTAQQKYLKKKRPIRPTSPTILEIPQLNIEPVEANFEIVPNPTADVQKTNDGNEDQVESSNEEADESVLSEKTAITSVTESSTKALTVPGTIDNEQFTEENEVVQVFAGTVENDDEATPKETNEEEDIKPDPETVKDKNKNTKLDANAKVNTQEFGNSDAGEPVVAKTYNFNEPIVEAGKEPVNLKLPVNSARKVMLF